MCFISVSDLKEINLQEGYFSWLKAIVINWCEVEEKCEESRAILEMHIS